MSRPTANSIDDTAPRYTYAVHKAGIWALMDQIIIIGSGMTGITCAHALADARLPVRVIDKGRGIGGRMATRRVAMPTGDLTFDHGAQYLRPRDPAFAKALKQAGARTWPDGPDEGRYVGVPGMASVPRAMAEGVSITHQAEVTALAWRDGSWHITSTAGDFSAKRVVLTIPAPQVAGLLGHSHPFVPDLAQVIMDPCLTLMAAFPGDSPRPFASRVDPMHHLPWIAQNSSKPGRSDVAVTWVAQADVAFSRLNIENSAENTAARMLPMLANVVGVDPGSALHARAHRWRYAQASRTLGQAFLRSDDQTLYAGGDWCLGPRAEDAWQSGRAMAKDILKHADVF